MEERPAFRGTGCKPGCLGWICSVDHYGAGGKVYHKLQKSRNGAAAASRGTKIAKEDGGFFWRFWSCLRKREQN